MKKSVTRFRRGVQISVCVGLVVIGVLTHYENQKIKYGGDDLIRDSVMLSAIDKIVGWWPSRHDMATFVQGDVWAMQIGNVKIVDPLAFVGSAAKTHSIYWPMAMAVLIPAGITIVFGKLFCGWICPMGLICEGIENTRHFLEKKGMSLPHIQTPGIIKYMVLGAGFLAALFSAPFLFLIYPPKLISGELYFWLSGAALGAGSVFIITIVSIEFIAGGRMWCRSVCPGGALYSLLSQFRFLRVKNNLSRCTQCGWCDRVCPYELLPATGKLSGECDHCGLCVDRCPHRTLTFQFEIPHAVTCIGTTDRKGNG